MMTATSERYYSIFNPTFLTSKWVLCDFYSYNDLQNEETILKLVLTQHCSFIIEYSFIIYFINVILFTFLLKE